MLTEFLSASVFIDSVPANWLPDFIFSISVLVNLMNGNGGAEIMLAEGVVLSPCPCSPCLKEI